MKKTLKPCGRRHRTRSAFTLIELLVVIAIIALLMSILMPALGQAKEHAKSMHCLVNLRNLGTAVQGYANDYRDTIVPSDYKYGEGDESGPKFRQDWPAFLTINGYITAPIYPEDDAPKAGEMPQGVSRSMPQCPSALTEVRARWGESAYGPVGPSDLPADLPGERRYIYTSYGSNGNNNVGQMPMRVHAQDGRKPYRMGVAPRPTDTVLLYDGSWSHNWWEALRINAPHMGSTRTNMAMMDGHAEGFDRADLPFDKLDVNYLNDNCPFPLWRFDQ